MIEEICVFTNNGNSTAIGKVIIARGVNKVILIGNVGGDPEVRYLPNGSAVTTVTLATSESWKDKQTGQNQERTEWHRVVFFNRLGEIAGEYLRKGSKVYVEGALRTNKCNDESLSMAMRVDIGKIGISLYFVLAYYG